MDVPHTNYLLFLHPVAVYVIQRIRQNLTVSNLGFVAKTRCSKHQRY